MPEFYLDVHDDYGTWKRLDSFTQGYIEAMFFTEMEHNSVRDGEDTFSRVWNPETDSSLPGDVTFSDLSQTALATLKADCELFQEKHAALLEATQELKPGSPDLKYARAPLDARRLGQLFWCARNGHGVAFTDDGDAYCLHDLQKAAQACGERSAYFGDDEMVHVS